MVVEAGLGPNSSTATLQGKVPSLSPETSLSTTRMQGWLKLADWLQDLLGLPLSLALWICLSLLLMEEINKLRKQEVEYWR